MWLGAGTIAAVGAVAMAAKQQGQAAYPEGYRSWTHVKSMVIQPGHPLEDPFAGIHHVYANPVAADGLRSGQWRDGAVLVFDLLDATSADHAITEGKRKLLGVMERDQNRFAATGGWGFEAFAGSSRTERLVTDGGRSCFDCHTGANRYVFSDLRD
jgi:hypothetical protein